MAEQIISSLSDANALDQILKDLDNNQFKSLVDSVVKRSGDDKKTADVLKQLNDAVRSSKYPKYSAYISLKQAELSPNSNDALSLVQRAVAISEDNKHLLDLAANFVMEKNLFSQYLLSTLNAPQDEASKQSQVSLLCEIIQDQRRTINQLKNDHDELKQKLTMNGLQDASVDDEFLRYSKLYNHQVEERARLEIDCNIHNLTTIVAGDTVNCVVQLHQDALVASCHPQKGIQVWDLSTCKLVRSFANDNEYPNIWAMEPFKGTDLLYVASPDVPGIGVYNWKTGELVDKIKHTSAITKHGQAKLKSFGIYRRYIIASMQDGYLTIFDVTEKGGKVVKRLGKHDDCVYSCEILPRGRIAIGDRGHVSIWNLLTEQREFCFMAHKGMITSLVLLDDGVLLSGSDAGMIKMWDIKTLSCSRMIFAHGGSSKINQIQMLGNNLFASVADDGYCKLFNLEDRKQHVLLRQSKPTLALCYFNRWLVTAGEDGSLQVLRCDYARGLTEDKIPPSIKVESE
ncbi:guanine nucleotide-binding protein [Acrasis kona]|uniref:Guanine nucleotide-binding protein n=1 Tax=Acrasis kona TaxID=1008807 RepID=A0AAW2ZNJ1_9EUKA